MANPKHSYFYFEKYEVRDGDSEYTLMTVRQTAAPLSSDDWMREFLEFSWSTNDERPWSQRRVGEFLRTKDPVLPVYNGNRIYHDFTLTEITEDEYRVLERYIR